MQLTDYFTQEGASFRFTGQQASRFAKRVAKDFNPIHHPDSRRFCVPGDLLFALGLANLGVSQQMQFQFTGMLGADKAVDFVDRGTGETQLCDITGKDYMVVNQTGNNTKEADLIRHLTQQYVLFSGQTFPHILLPLMADNKVMINPDRPTVIYQGMSLSLDELDLDKQGLEEMSLVLSDSELEVNGRRGIAKLSFDLISQDQKFGSGSKEMVLGGLSEFDAARIQVLVDDYEQKKKHYAQRTGSA